jgi:transcriptional regulator with XRE-family HTH domain
MDFLKRQVGDRIWYAREQLHMTQEELSDCTELPLETIRQLEAGARFPTADETGRLGYAVCRDLHEFFDPDFLFCDALYILTSDDTLKGRPAMSPASLDNE